MEQFFTVKIKDVELTLASDEKIFSPSGLDEGTRFMLEAAVLEKGQKVLDLGCGCGVVGIYGAAVAGEENVVMSDVQPESVVCARENAALNGFSGIRVYESDGFHSIPPEEKFDVILSNPPYHADFSVPKHFIEEGFKRLNLGGRLYMVTRRLDWYKNKLTTVFGGVRVTEKGGYYLFTAEKRGEKRQKKEPENKGGLSKKLERKQQKRKR